MANTSLDKMAPDALAALSSVQKYQNEKKKGLPPVDIRAISYMKLDLSFTYDTDYENTGQAADFSVALKQRDMLDQLWNYRSENPEGWASLTPEERARCTVLLNQRELFNLVLKNELDHHCISNYDDNFKLRSYPPSANEKREGQKMLGFLESLQLTAHDDYKAYLQREQNSPPPPTTEQRMQLAQQELIQFRQMFGQDTKRLSEMDDTERNTFIAASKSVDRVANHAAFTISEEFEESVGQKASLETPEAFAEYCRTHPQNASESEEDYQKRTKQAFGKNRLNNYYPDLSKRPLFRDIGRALGSYYDGDSLTEEERKIRVAEADNVLSRLSTLCQIDIGKTVPGVTHEQAIEKAYEAFNMCFERFYGHFEQVKSQLGTALTPEGLCVQGKLLGGFYSYWQSMIKISRQSHSLMRRISADQHNYMREVSTFLYDLTSRASSKTEVVDGVEFYKRDQSILSTTTQDELTHHSSEILQLDYEKIKDTPYGQKVKTWAITKGISTDCALYTLHRMGFLKEDMPLPD